MTKYPWDHVEPENWASRLAEIDLLLPNLYERSERAQLLQAERSWLEQQIADRASNEAAVVRADGTWVD